MSVLRGAEQTRFVSGAGEWHRALTRPFVTRPALWRATGSRSPASRPSSVAAVQEHSHELPAVKTWGNGTRVTVDGEYAWKAVSEWTYGFS
jgi:hypothetical protein